MKKEIVKYLKDYLNLKKGKNSLADVTGIIREVFKCKGTVYPFERDIAGRMMRTRNYTMQELINEGGGKEVHVIAADRDWWDKNKFWFSIAMVLIGTIVGSVSSPLSNFLNNLINGKDQSQESYRVKLQTNTPILHRADSVSTLEIDKIDSTQHK